MNLDKIIEKQKSLIMEIENTRVQAKQVLEELIHYRDMQQKKQNYTKRAKESIKNYFSENIRTFRKEGVQYYSIDSENITIQHKIASYQKNKIDETHWFTVKKSSLEYTDFMIFSLETIDSDIIHIILNKEEYIEVTNNSSVMSDGRINIGLYLENEHKIKSSKSDIDLSNKINDFKSILNFKK